MDVKSIYLFHPRHHDECCVAYRRFMCLLPFSLPSSSLFESRVAARRE